jgi:hypothetical protein
VEETSAWKIKVEQRPSKLRLETEHQGHEACGGNNETGERPNKKKKQTLVRIHARSAQPKEQQETKISAENQSFGTGLEQNPTGRRKLRMARREFLGVAKIRQA